MDSQDEFIILACDGLWDVMTSARAVESVRLSLRRHNDPDRAAKVRLLASLASLWDERVGAETWGNEPDGLQA